MPSAIDFEPDVSEPASVDFTPEIDFQPDTGSKVAQSTISPKYTQRMIRDRTVTPDVRKQYLQREQDLARQEGEDVQTYDTLGSKAGYLVHGIGNVAKGAVYDTAAAMSGQGYDQGHNVYSAIKGEPMPLDEKLEGATGIPKFASDVSQGISHMLPQLAVSGGVAGLLGRAGGVMTTAAGQPSTVAHMAAAGGVFGFDENGFNPQAAATMALFPVAGKVGSGLMLKSLEKVGVPVASESAKAAWATTGALLGTQAYMDALNTPVYLDPNVSKEEKLHTFANGLAMNLGFVIHSKLREAGQRFDKRVVDQAAKEAAADVVRGMRPEDIAEITKNPNLDIGDGRTMEVPLEPPSPISAFGPVPMPVEPPPPAAPKIEQYVKTAQNEAVKLDAQQQASDIRIAEAQKMAEIEMVKASRMAELNRLETAARNEAPPKLPTAKPAPEPVKFTPLSAEELIAENNARALAAHEAHLQEGRDLAALDAKAVEPQIGQPQPARIEPTTNPLQISSPLVVESPIKTKPVVSNETAVGKKQLTKPSIPAEELKVEPTTVKSQADAFDSLLIEHGVPNGWFQDYTKVRMTPRVRAQDQKGGDVQQNLMHAKQMKLAREFIARELGIKNFQASSMKDRADALPKLREYIAEIERIKAEEEMHRTDETDIANAPIEFVPEETKPKLLRGENQGDLISSTQKEDLSLVQEKGVDYGRLSRELDEAKKVVEEARQLQEKQQTKLFEKTPPPAESQPSRVAAETAGAETPSKPPETPLQTINRAGQVRLSVPAGATFIRGTDSKGRKSVVPLDNFKKGNPFQGADIVTVEAGTIGKDKAFKPVEGDVKVVDKSKNIDTGALGGVGMGGAKPGEFETEGVTAVSAKNASMKKLASELGVSDYWESLKSKAVSDEASWQSAMAKIDRDPGWQDRLIKEFTEKGPRSMETIETIALDHRLIDLKIERARVTRELEQAYEDGQTFPNRQVDVAELQIREAELIEKIQNLMEINRASGTLMGRGFRARQLMMKADYSLEQMLRDKSAARGGKPVEPGSSEYAEIKRLNKELQEALEKADKLQLEHEQKIKAMEAEIAAIETNRNKAQGELTEAVEERVNLNRKLSGARMPLSDSQIIKQRIAALLRKEFDLKRRIATGDLSKKPRREIEPTAPLLAAKARVAELKHVFNKMLLADRQERRTVGRKIWDSIKQTGHAYVNIMSSFDFSAPRQAFWAILSNTSRLATSPKAGFELLRRPFVEMFSAFKNENTARRLAERIKSRRNADNGVDKIAGVEFTDLEGHKLTGAEENARSVLDEWAEKPYQTGNAAKNVATAPAKFLAKGVRMSNRAFITYLNTTRAGLLDHLLEVNYHDRPPTDTELKVIGNLVNVATGRGKMNPLISKASSELIWAPKLLTSRLQTLTGQPLWGGAPWKDSAKARMVVVKEYVRGILAASALAAVQRAFTGQDPDKTPSTSSDFGKVVRGLTRIDPWAGFQQLVVLEERIRKGETTTGKGVQRDIGTYGTGEVIWNFFKGKARPDITAMVRGVIAAIDLNKPLKDVRITPKEAAIGAIPVPIAVSEMVSVMRDRGMSEGAIIQALSEFGAGVNVYEDKKKTEKPTR